MLLHKSLRAETRPEPAGLVIHDASRYDFIVWLFTLGNERRLRERMLGPARLKPGESVIDLGCGTGSLAMLAKERVGAHGSVMGVDASEAMIARARRKAAHTGADISFGIGVAQAIPVADDAADVVLSTLMLHHVPRRSRGQMLREIKRALKPDGRVLIVDFARRQRDVKTFWDKLHRHGSTKPEELTELLQHEGFAILDAGPVGYRDLYFVLATTAQNPSTSFEAVLQDQGRGPHRSTLFWLLIASAAGALIALHASAASGLFALQGSWTAWPLMLIGAVIALKLTLKLALVVAVRRQLGKERRGQSAPPNATQTE